MPQQEGIGLRYYFGVQLYSEVNTFADLPAANLHAGEIHVVLTTTGVWFVNRRRRGLWRSDGAVWTRMGIAPTKEDMSLGVDDHVQFGKMLLDQEAADDEIQEFKSSDVAHGITDFAGTDIYATFLKIEALEGGLAIRGFAEGKYAMALVGMYTTDDVAKGVGARAPIEIHAWKKAGAGIGVQGANANTVVIKSGANTRFILDEDGDILRDGTCTAFQDHDDIELLAELEVQLDRSKKLKSKEKYKKKDLEDTKLLRPFLSSKRLNMLQMGAIRQMYEKIVFLEQQVRLLQR